MTTPPPVVLHPGDPVQFVGADGQMLEGRAARADPLRRADGEPGPWTIFVVPDAEPQAARGWD